MEIILLEKNRKLGEVGQTVSVKPGYGRNYLIPKGFAVPATASNRAMFDVRRAELEKAALEHIQAAQQRAAALLNKTITIVAKTGTEGKLFGSIGTRDLSDAISATGINVAKSEVRLPNGVLRAIGEYDIALQLHSDVSCVVKVVITPEQ